MRPLQALPVSLSYIWNRQKQWISEQVNRSDTNPWRKTSIESALSRNAPGAGSFDRHPGRLTHWHLFLNVSSTFRGYTLVTTYRRAFKNAKNDK